MRAIRRTLTVSAALLLSACADREPTLPSISAAKGGGGSGEVAVDSTNPSSGPQDSTLNVRIKGANFDRGSRAEWALSGVVSDKVRVNSTSFVNSKELVANITIAADAPVDLYDVIVTASTGKKGIGSELFAVRPKGHSEALPEIAFSGTTNLQVMNFDGSHETIAARDTGVATISWASTGSGTTTDPWHLIYDNGSGCSRGLFRLDVAVVNGEPLGMNRTALTTTPIACHPAWSPVADTVVFAEGARMVGQVSHLFLMSAQGGVEAEIYSSPPDGYATYFPVWSPDGSRIAFVEGNVNDGLNDRAIRVLDRTTGVATTVVQPGVFCSIRTLDWARTKDVLAFSALTTSARFGECTAERVYTLELNPLGTPRLIAAGVGPTWSPHDSKLAYSSNGKIVSIDLTTLKTRTLAGNGFWPEWRR